MCLHWYLLKGDFTFLNCTFQSNALLMEIKRSQCTHSLTLYTKYPLRIWSQTLQTYVALTLGCLCLRLGCISGELWLCLWWRTRLATRLQCNEWQLSSPTVVLFVKQCWVYDDETQGFGSAWISIPTCYAEWEWSLWIDSGCTPLLSLVRTISLTDWCWYPYMWIDCMQLLCVSLSKCRIAMNVQMVPIDQLLTTDELKQRSRVKSTRLTWSAFSRNFNFFKFDSKF